MDHAFVTSLACAPIDKIFKYGLIFSYFSPLCPRHLDTADRLVPDRAFLKSSSQAGVNFGNIRALEYALQRTNGGAALSRSQALDSTTVKMALLNVRSILNKTYIINDFFTSQNLDFMFITETWLKYGDHGPLFESSPDDSNFINSPRTAGHGEGVATIFKNSFKCRSQPLDNFSSFEVQLLKFYTDNALLCALIYRPPHNNKMFLQEFSEFLSSLFPFYDKLLILVNFNIHVLSFSSPG